VRFSPAQKPAREEGFVLIEIMVSALVLTIASIGVIALLQTTTRSQAELRNSSEAYALAQEDQARMASMRLSSLNKLDKTKDVQVGNTLFHVRSKGVFINDKTSTPSCGEGTSSADYVEITSIVTWNGMNASEKAKIVSVLSPSNGSLNANNGTLAIAVTTKQQIPVIGAKVFVGAYSGLTDALGCAVFADLPAADYTATIDGTVPGVVSTMGSFTQGKAVTVVGTDTKTEKFEFDRPGTIQATFKYRVGTSGEFLPAKADSVVAGHAEMPEVRFLWTADGSRQLAVDAKPLFPFTSPYRFYAGFCGENNPDKENKGLDPTAFSSATVIRDQTVVAPQIQLPVYEPTIWTGTSSSSKGEPMANADVRITDAKCKKNGSSVIRKFTTNSSGKLTELGLPWGIYNICVDSKLGDETSGVRRLTAENVTIKNLAGPTTADFYLGGGTSGQRCS
jgi:Tfp pilus assembly protein PilV